MKNEYKNKAEEGGYVLLGVVFIIALSLIISSGMLAASSTSAKTRSIVNKQADYYYEVENSVGKIVGWLQANSKNLVNAFTVANFDNNFDIGTPSIGSNEGTHFGVPTMVKMHGTNESVMLSNNAFFGTASFPSTTNIDTGTTFNAISEFQNADLGNANARVILVWARETDGSYEPIFRIDVMTGNNPDRGVHSYSYVYSNLVTSGGADSAFYGRNFLTTKGGNNKCFSYMFTHNGSSWSKGAARSNCTVSSDSIVTLKSQINGNAKSLANSGVTLQHPTGEVAGDICEGSGCHSDSLPVLDTFLSYCPIHSGDNSPGNETWPAGGCWRDVEVQKNKTLVLTDTTNPYYFRALDFGNGATIEFQPDPYDGVVTLYVEEINANNSRSSMNGNQHFNMSNAPHQALIKYYGTKTLKLNGNADMYGFIVASNANVEMLGTFDFYGGIKAKSFWVNGNGRFNYDENGGASSPTLSDITFSLRKASQRYR